MSFGEATYWHNHPDLPRLAQKLHEQLEQQRMTESESPRRCGARPLQCS